VNRNGWYTAYIQILCSDVTDGRTDGHRSTAKTALMHGVYIRKKQMFHDQNLHVVQRRGMYRSKNMT